MSLFSLLAEVLFIGHSLVGPDLPGLVEQGLALQDRPAEVAAQVINGAPLTYNWAHSAEAEGVDGRALLGTGRVTDLILTEAIPLADQIRWNDTAGQIAAFATLGRAANPGMRVYLYETWPSLDASPGALPWREQLTADLPLWEAAAREAGVGPVALIPAGQVMGFLADEVAAGRVPGFTNIRDFFRDDIHLNGRGLYVVALVHLAVLTGQNPEGLPPKLGRRWPSRDAGLTDAQALALQRIVWRGVTAYAEARGGAASAVAPVAAPLDSVAALPPGAPDILPAFPTVQNPNLMIGLAGVNDWSVQQPFLNVMKTARPWIGHLPGQWGGWTHDDLAAAGALSPEGWPLAIPPGLTGITTLVLTDLPAGARGVAGRYVMTWAGKADFTLDGRARLVDRGEGRLRFDYTPGEGAVSLTLTAIDQGDPLRDITIVREDREALLATGAIFNPDWLARIRGVTGLRFMDWMATNDSALSRSADRPLPTDYTWARIGVPAEVMVALANELDADAWFTLPHLAEDGLVRDYAVIAEQGLEPGRRAWVEYSNEVWNWQFAQARWAEAQGKARWGQEYSWVQYYALRAGEVATIWAEVFGAAAPARLVRVVGTQTGHLGLEEQILNAPLVMAEGRPAPHTLFDAYAITGYFAGGIGAEDRRPALQRWLRDSHSQAEGEARARGLTGAAAAEHVEAHRLDAAIVTAAAEIRDGAILGEAQDTVAHLTGTVFPHHADVAARHGLALVMYEGGTHVVGLGPVVDDAELTEFFTALNYSAEMGTLYRQVMEGWAAVTDAPFNAFVDVSTPVKWGSWGALRHLGDDNPRWQALATGCDAC